MGNIAVMIHDVGVLKKDTVLRIMQRDVKTAIGKMTRVRWADDNSNAHESLVKPEHYREVYDG